jgi:hypothetical protein
MKNKIITFVFFASLLIQNSTQTQFDLKQWARDNKIHLIYGGVIFALLCGGCAGYYKYKKLKSTTEDNKMTNKERQDLEDYHAIKFVKNPSDDDKCWYSEEIHYNNININFGFLNENTQQEKSFKDMIQENRNSGKIPQITTK